jgi:hypothetical protein
MGIMSTMGIITTGIITMGIMSTMGNPYQHRNKRSSCRGRVRFCVY